MLKKKKAHTSGITPSFSRGRIKKIVIDHAMPMNKDDGLDNMDVEDENCSPLENEDDIIFDQQKFTNKHSREGYQRHMYTKKPQHEYDSVRDYIIRMSDENKFWEQKFEKYYRKLAKLQQLYDRYMTGLRTVYLIL